MSSGNIVSDTHVFKYIANERESKKWCIVAPVGFRKRRGGGRITTRQEEHWQNSYSCGISTSWYDDYDAEWLTGTNELMHPHSPLNLWLKRRDDVRAEPELNNNSKYTRIHLHFAKSYLTASKRKSLRVSLIFITMFFFHHFSATKLPRPPWWCCSAPTVSVTARPRNGTAVLLGFLRLERKRVGSN